MFASGKTEQVTSSCKRENGLDLMLLAKLSLILKADLVLLLNVCTLETESE